MTLEQLVKDLPLLSGVIYALVEWIKKLGVTGNWLTVSAFASGLVIGIGYRYAVLPMITFADWFWAVMFGLLAGGIATGVYKAQEGMAVKTGATIAAATIKADARQTAKIIAAVEEPCADPEITKP